MITTDGMGFNGQSHKHASVKSNQIRCHRPEEHTMKRARTLARACPFNPILSVAEGLSVVLLLAACAPAPAAQ
jgi:hypothetical protein